MWNCDLVLAWKLIPTIQGLRPPVPSSLSAWCEESSSRCGTLSAERSGAVDATRGTGGFHGMGMTQVWGGGTQQAPSHPEEGDY